MQSVDLVALGRDVCVVGPDQPGAARLLTPEALGFIALLERAFRSRRQDVLRARAERRRRLQAGERPDFLSETKAVRESAWSVSPLPPDLQDRRVEITGPADRKMIINALNSGARCFMADLEDASCPTWETVIRGQANLYDAVRRTIGFTNPKSGKTYALRDKTATLIVRPRGWHMEEKHLFVEDRPCSGSIVDFGLYFFHNAAEILRRGSGPYFYLPKIESHLEARLWNDIFIAAQDHLGIPRGTIRATVLIETILAAFEMEEILYELREHSAGLNCGRWDYIFSIIKNFSNDADFIMPDRDQVTMTVPCMRAYTLLAIKTCHRRGAPCIGGMAAQIPVRGDDAANEQAFAYVRADKEREVADGHDGSWVAHPGLVPLVSEAFDKVMTTPNQIHRQRDDVTVSAMDLLTTPKGSITMDGVTTNIQVGLRYLEAWLNGEGCVPLFNLMEDAATAEISRAQLWQWARHEVSLADGTVMTRALTRRLIAEETARIAAEVGADAFARTRFPEAAQLFEEMSIADLFPEFLTLPAYDLLLARGC